MSTTSSRTAWLLSLSIAIGALLVVVTIRLLVRESSRRANSAVHPLPSPSTTSATVERRSLSRLAPPAAPSGLAARPAAPSGLAAVMPNREEVDPASVSFEDMEARWSGETDDQEWTVNAETFIGAQLETFGDGGELPPFAIRCRTTVCQAEFSQAELGPLMKLAEAQRESGRLFKYQRLESDGASLLRVYCFRESVVATTANSK
jgi:hypothetical protein